MGRATLLTMAFVLLSRVMGMARDAVIGRVFGQGVETNIYNRAFAVPDMMYLLLAGGALSTVFIPVFTQHLKDKDDAGAWRTLSRIVSLVALAAGTIVLILEIAAPLVARLAAPRFSEGAVAQMIPLTRILLPAQFFFFVGGLLIAALQAKGRWVVSNAAPILYNLGIILGALSQIGKAHPTTAAMTWGALTGALAGNFLLPALELWRIGGRLRFAIELQHPTVRQFGRLLLPAMLGLGLSQISFLILGFFLPETGALSALKNANNLTQVPIGIFAQASALVLFPTLSMLAAREDWKAFRTEIHFGIRRILFLTLPASLWMAVLAEPIVHGIYRGGRFGESDVAQAALALRLYSLATFAWSAQAVLGRGFFAMQDTRTPLSITKFMIVLFTVGCFVISWAGWSFGAFALVTSLIATLNMVCFFVALQKKAGGLAAYKLMEAALRITLAAGLSGAAAWWIQRSLGPPTNLIQAGTTLLLSGGAALAVYVLACLALRVPELKSIGRMFRRTNRTVEP